MGSDQDFFDEFFQGMRALAESSFPRKCANCGRTFATAEQFLSETRNITETRTGLKQAVDDDGSTIIEAFRNCPCGSTLMDFFSNRRDISEAGQRKRQSFTTLLDFLVANGLEHNVARTELLKVMHGEKSELLATIRPPCLYNLIL